MYLWYKAIHIIALIAWFAGIFYIWRLFVYHVEATSEEVKSTLAVMERKLYMIIMRPAMFITLIFGFTLFGMQWDALVFTIWIWLKIFLVCLIVGHHHLANYYRKKLLEGVTYPSKKFRILNEVPTLLLIAIVILVVVKPF